MPTKYDLIDSAKKVLVRIIYDSQALDFANAPVGKAIRDLAAVATLLCQAMEPDLSPTAPSPASELKRFGETVVRLQQEMQAKDRLSADPFAAAYAAAERKIAEVESWIRSVPPPDDMTAAKIDISTVGDIAKGKRAYVDGPPPDLTAKVLAILDKLAIRRPDLLAEVRDDFLALISREVEAERERAAKVVDDWAANYPANVFSAESNCPDAIAGTALRKVLPNIAEKIRSGE